MKIKRSIKYLYSSILQILNGSIQHQKVSYSQSGEDIIIDYLFKARNIFKPTCLDIGSYHPVELNNTYKFYLNGSRIVNIDANPTAIQKFKEFRPKDVNLNVGVGAETGVFDFYIMDYETLNTFSLNEKNHLESLGHKMVEIKKINMLPINTILEKYFNDTAPDFISIDAEGVDFEIIKALEFNKYAPKVICIESVEYTPDGTGSKRINLCEFIENAGYFEYANTNINSIFVNKQWWYLVG